MTERVAIAVERWQSLPKPWRALLIDWMRYNEQELISRSASPRANGDELDRAKTVRVAIRVLREAARGTR